MAELSTLSPSPPALGDPHAVPSISPSSSVLPVANSPAPESAREMCMHKSFLFTEKALAGNTSASLSGDSSLTPHPSSSSKLHAETLPPSSVHDETAPQREELAEKDAETGAHGIKQETKTNDPLAAQLLNSKIETPALSSEPSAQSQVQQASPSSDLNPGPNLYPNVHVAHNPTLVMDDGEFAADQPQNTAGTNPTPASPSSTNMAASATAEEEKPQPLQQTQNHQRNPPPLSPKPSSPNETGTTDPPGTPTRAEQHSPTVPLIHEPAYALSNPNPRQAPDTFSYLESASMMSGTLESLSGFDDGSSVGSDSEINGLTVRRIDKYGFLGGNQYSESEKEVRVEVARQREMKWLDMFRNWDKWIKHRFQKVKLRCRKGIPSSLRGTAWQLLSNSKELLEANKGKFEQQDLYRILKAYTIYRPDEGYCQAQAPVAAVLLMHMPAEQAFWCLVQICEKYLPGYYSAGLEAIQLDGEIFFSLLRRTCPMAYRHLKKFKIDPILYMTEWFMCVFSRTLPWVCVLRVWDMFFSEVKIVFRVGLVLLKQMLGSVDKLRELQGMYETMERLRNISPDTIKEDILVQEIVALPVTEALIEKECSIQVRKWRESRGELTHQPGRRFHGTKAIYEYKRRAAAISSGGSFSFLGSPIPPPGPLRASSSLLSLPGFRKSKAPFHSQVKKGSFSGPSGMESIWSQSPPAITSLGQGSSHKPPIPPGPSQRAPTPHFQSPLAGNAAGSQGPAQPSESTSAQNQPAASAPAQSTPPPPSTLIVSEQITLALPSPTANNAPLAPCPDSKKEEAPAADATTGEEEGMKKKKSKEDKKKEKEDEKRKLKEKKEKEKAEKERLRKEKERVEKERKKGGKKKDKGGAEAEDKNGAAAARDSA
uniref:Rab-GAP TBC domain-containing protein n=1 Tax=Monopterus albus TaxID=43700 RepID=A0A3Q3J1G5_MONAL